MGKILKNNINYDDPVEIYFAMLVKYQNQNLSVDHIDFINQLPIHLTKKIKGLEFSICHNLLTNMYGGDLSPEQHQENFDQLFAENKCDVAIYAHIKLFL